MKLLSVSLLVFFVLFLPQEISGGHLKNLTFSIDGATNVMSDENDSQDLHNEDLEIDVPDSRPFISGEEINTTIIPFPVSNCSPLKYISLHNIQVISLIKKKTSLDHHYYLFFSNAIQFSPLVNILRI